MGTPTLPCLLVIGWVEEGFSYPHKMAVTTHKILSLAPEEEQALVSTATHECGHQVIASYFGLRPEVCITGPWTGVCCHRGGTPLQTSAVGWGGAVAEDVVGRRSKGRTLPKVDLSDQTLDQWCREIVRSGYANLSSLDVACICEFHAPLESCKAAFQIISKRVSELKITSKVFADRFRHVAFAALERGDPEADERECQQFIVACRVKAAAEVARERQETFVAHLAAADALPWGDVPMPPSFPQPIESFWRVVVSKNGTVTSSDINKFHEWLRHEAKGDEQFAAGLFTCLSAGFAGANSWCDWARKFRAWFSIQHQQEVQPL